jgi:protein-S-isoprenylcysteine O-methyltransferase Ste14
MRLYASGAAPSPGQFTLHVLNIFGVLLLVIGSADYIRCIWDFASKGQADSPNIIVASNVYKVVRNPMYISLVIVLLSESLMFTSEWILEYAAGSWILIHLLYIAT